MGKMIDPDLPRSSLPVALPQLGPISVNTNSRLEPVSDCAS